MKSTLLLLALIAFLGLACGEEKQDAKPQKPSARKSQKVILGLQQLLENQERYKDQKITLAAYFVTHFEGNWICADNGNQVKRLKTSLSITNYEASQFKLLKATRSRIESRYPNVEVTDEFLKYIATWEFEDGVPALITGTFRGGDDHPFLELKEVREVEVDNSQWKSAQSKGKQPGAVQPATQSAGKTPVKDQPSTPASENGPR